ncbi:MAG: Rieske (2Fe-2S) protein [Candidatus Kapabacteria bacterium]|nr:Rieske (2Fe-2S) protein [Candidatus Kapabacteria bacterium]
MTEREHDDSTSRRNAIERIARWVLAIAGGAVTVPYLFLPKLRSASVLRIENPELRVRPFLLTSTNDGNIIVFRDDAGEQPSYTALSLRCSHANCTVRYIHDESKFVCPCHGGAFRKDGSVLQAPPKEPLQSIPVIQSGDGSLYLRID